MAKVHNFDDVKHKRLAPERYNSNSYRIFGAQDSEEVTPPSRQNQTRAPAPFYTESDANALQRQGFESRHDHHAARPVNNNQTTGMRTNFDPNGPMRAAHGERDESRWWDWTHSKSNSSDLVLKQQDERTRGQNGSYQNVFNYGVEDQSQYSRQNSRYSANPKHTRTVGIVPITALKSDDIDSVDPQNVERTPYQQQYVSQTKLDYAKREQQYNAPVSEPPKPMERNRTMPSAKIERASSMWDLFHPHNDADDQMSVNPRKYQRPLPAIKRNESHNNIWSDPAAYAYNYRPNRDYNQAAMVDQTNIE
ncbi:unnamed protein product [Adineta ricciae]|uniref:Uncharacterized protein n=1 Tax=Adineta ricciae TaxID=249248 RepID=A0A814CU25_ADIRI|nr:unnamed protein product [Adineta ricciae]